MAKTVWLDAGHGGRDSGAVGNGLYEKSITLSLALRVGEILTKDYEGIKVLYSRKTDKTMTLKERTDLANKAKPDFFFSIHVNSGGGTGYEDFIWSGKVQSLTPVYRDIVHEAVKPVLKKYGIRNRGKKKANFHVLRETNAPAMLVETLFIDHPTDAKLLKNKQFLEDIAKAYAQGISKALGGKKKKKVSPPPAKPSETLYRVQVGAFKNKSNAEKLAKQVKAKGFDCFIKLVDGLYKVQAGAYRVKKNAENQRDRLKKAGFDAWITTK